MATRRTTGGTPCPPAYGAEAHLPPETILGPHGSRLPTGLSRSDQGQGRGLLRQMQMESRGRDLILQKYQTKSGLRNTPQLGRTLQGNGNTPTRGRLSSYDRRSTSPGAGTSL
jgi:hypothetical protein